MGVHLLRTILLNSKFHTQAVSARVSRKVGANIENYKILITINNVT